MITIRLEIRAFVDPVGEIQFGTATKGNSVQTITTSTSARKKWTKKIE